jgi:hypothetical protein
MNEEKNEQKIDEDNFLKESAKKYEEVINKIDENADIFFNHVKKTEEDPFSEEQLVQKIITNTFTMFCSDKMQEIIKTMEQKLEPEIIKAIINMVAFSTAAATHQAIYFYDELLHRNLEIKFLELQKFIEEMNMHVETHEAVLEVFKKRLDEVIQSLQINKITK